jgi:hypothetical protein
MNKGRLLHQEKLKEHPDLGVYGIFNTNKVSWRFWVISFNSVNNGHIELTSELCGYKQAATYESIEKFGKEFKSTEEGKKFIQEYKIKWETGSNNTTQEVRAKKLDNILDGDE